VKLWRDCTGLHPKKQRYTNTSNTNPVTPINHRRGPLEIKNLLI
jgi:hypothetical protein